MKIMIIALVFLLIIPAIAFGGNAAPYTEDALRKINKSLQDTPREEFGNKQTRAGFHKKLIEYNAKIFENAGFSYFDTINKIVDDMKNNPEAIPKDRQSVYDRVYMTLNIIMYECDSDKVDCLEFFPEDTRLSVKWFMERSEFSHQEMDTPPSDK